MKISWPKRETFYGFNALGASHTAPGGNSSANFDDYKVRTDSLLDWILAHKPRLMALNEFQILQQTYALDDVWFAARYSSYFMEDNGIFWKTKRFAVVKRGVLSMPYFNGELKLYPYVILRTKSFLPFVKEKTFAILSAHNPANTRGDHMEERHDAWHIEGEWAQFLMKKHPGINIYVYADRNAEAKNVMSVLSEYGAVLVGADTQRGIDQITRYGDKSKGSRFRTYWNNFIAKMSDHPIVSARIKL